MAVTHASDAYSRLKAADREDEEGPASRLVQRLIAINTQREAKLRQEELDRIAEEDRQRKIKLEDEDRAIKLAELAQKVAAMSDRPTEEKDVEVARAQLTGTPSGPAPAAAPAAMPQMTPEELAVHEAAGAPAGMPAMSPEELAVHEATGTPAPEPALPRMTPEELEAHMATGEPAASVEEMLPTQADLGVGGDPAGVPESIPLTQKRQVRTATPTHKLKIGDLELDVPLYDRADIRERGWEDFADTLRREELITDARTRMVTLPNDPKLGAMGGQTVPLVLAQTLLPAMYRQQTTRPITFDLGDRLRVERPDGTTEYMPKGATPRAPGESGSGKLKTVFDTETGINDLVTEDEIRANPDRYRAPMLAAQTQEYEKLASNMAAFGDLKASLQDVRDLVGPGVYQLNEIRQKVPGFESDPAFRAFQQQLNALSNEEVKRITGAQMSAAEFDRLKKGMVTGELRLEELENGLYLWERSMQRRQASLAGRLAEWDKENPYNPPYRLGKTGGKTTSNTPAPSGEDAATKKAALIAKYGGSN